MKQMFQFELIGQPLQVSHIERLIERSPEGSFASGDFSAATDNVKIELTKLFFERLIHRLLHQEVVSMRHVDILRRVLYEHEIHYPPMTDAHGVPQKLPPVLQKNGQLMGSVLSFPVLCAINLCTYWHAVQPDVEDVADLNVLINGDDILFRTDQQKYDHWLATLPEAGLFPSPGKNFFHDKYCTVNSELFSVHGNRVKSIPFFNVGMLLGKSKVARDGMKQKPIHCLHAKAMNGALNPVRADKRFKYYNLEKLQNSSKSADGYQMNYYIPPHLGGLGMKMPGMTFISAERAKNLKGSELALLEPYTIVTGVQRKIAKYLYDKWTSPYLKPPMKPIGQEVDVDREQNGFKDIPNSDYRVLIPDEYCPMPPWCRELVTDIHKPNWMCSPMDSCEQERLKFEAKGVRLYRSAKLKMPCHEVAIELVAGVREYKYVGWNPDDRSRYLGNVDRVAEGFTRPHEDLRFEAEQLEQALWD